MTPTSESIVFAYAARPAIAKTERGTAPAIQFILETGEGLTVAMSGVGMAQVAKDLERFLADNPALAATETLKRQ
jgi:hypothetical protein